MNEYEKVQAEIIENQRKQIANLDAQVTTLTQMLTLTETKNKIYKIMIQNNQRMWYRQRIRENVN